MSFIDQAADVGGPGHDVGPQELETGDTLDSHPIHVDRVMCASFSPSYDSDVEQQVNFNASCDRVLYPFSVSFLIVAMRPITVILSTNLTIGLDLHTGLHS